MGLDATIRRADGRPLGLLAEVQQTLAAVFPGTVFGQLPSGIEKIQAATKRGVVFPEVIRQSLESTPAQQGGDFEGPGFSVQFNFGVDEIVQQVEVVLHGMTTGSDPMFARLEREFGWLTTYP